MKQISKRKKTRGHFKSNSDSVILHQATDVTSSLYNHLFSQNRTKQTQPNQRCPAQNTYLQPGTPLSQRPSEGINKAVIWSSFRYEGLLIDGIDTKTQTSELKKVNTARNQQSECAGEGKCIHFSRKRDNHMTCILSFPKGGVEGREGNAGMWPETKNDIFLDLSSYD